MRVGEHRQVCIDSTSRSTHDQTASNLIPSCSITAFVFRRSEFASFLVSAWLFHHASATPTDSRVGLRRCQSDIATVSTFYISLYPS